MRRRVDAVRFLSRGVISAAGVIASLAFALPARAESRRHDGFYAAANGGIGYVKEFNDGNANDDLGLSVPASLWMGHTYGKVAFGGGLTWDYWVQYGVALFADIYPDPKGGFHIMPSLGWCLWFPAPAMPNGPVLAAGVGYDFWVGPEVSMGVMARLMYAPLHDNRDDSYTMYTPTVVLTLTYQ
jgi:hypothetical protein